VSCSVAALPKDECWEAYGKHGDRFRGAFRPSVAHAAPPHPTTKGARRWSGATPPFRPGRKIDRSRDVTCNALINLCSPSLLARRKLALRALPGAQGSKSRCLPMRTARLHRLRPAPGPPSGPFLENAESDMSARLPPSPTRRGARPTEISRFAPHVQAVTRPCVPYAQGVLALPRPEASPIRDRMAGSGAPQPRRRSAGRPSTHGSGTSARGPAFRVAGRQWISHGPIPRLGAKRDAEPATTVPRDEPARTARTKGAHLVRTSG